MMASVTKINDHVLASAVGIDMSILALIIPIFIVIVLAGWKNTLGVLPAALVVGVSYAVTCFLVSHYIGAELPAAMSSFVSIVCLVAFLKFWKPKKIWRFPGDPAVASETAIKHSAAELMKAWSPFVLLLVVMCTWSIPALKLWAVNECHLLVNIPNWPFLDGLVYRTAPVVAKPSVYTASYRWEFGTTAGTGIFVAALLSMLVLRISPGTGARVFFKTLKQMKFALLTLASVLGIAFVANYSGMSYTLALALSYYTGRLFPFFSPVIGWLGVFLTGSVTSSAVLFGKLQQVTAMQIGVNPVLTTSADLAGGVAGKLISPQSLAIACAATGMIGREADIFRKSWRYSVIMLAMLIVVIVIQAYLVPGIVPQDISGVTP
jgi:lactate permease